MLLRMPPLLRHIYHPLRLEYSLSESRGICSKRLVLPSTVVAVFGLEDPFGIVVVSVNAVKHAPGILES